MAIAAEAAARPGKVLTRKAATESPARTAEMAPAKAAAQVSAAAEPAAYMSATTNRHRVHPHLPRRAQTRQRSVPGESGSRGQDDHDLT